MMTVSKLEQQTQMTIERFPEGAMVETGLGATVLALIADWRLMRDRLVGFRDGDLHKDIAEQAGDTLGDLRLEP